MASTSAARRPSGGSRASPASTRCGPRWQPWRRLAVRRCVRSTNTVRRSASNFPFRPGLARDTRPGAAYSWVRTRMNTAWLAPHAARPSARKGWGPLERRVLKHRPPSARPVHRRGARLEAPLRDAFETWRARPRGSRFVARCITLGLAALACADLIVDGGVLRLSSWIAAVLLAGTASLLAVAAAEPAGFQQARRWHLQAVASAVVMFMLMANGTDAAPGDLLWFVIVVGAASTLVAMATSYREGARSGASGIYLAVDSAIVGFTTSLVMVAVASPTARAGGAAVLLGAFAAAGYAVAVATRPAIRLDPRGSDALFLGGVLVLCLSAAGE